jgi:hypothetical protein
MGNQDSVTTEDPSSFMGIWGQALRKSACKSGNESPLNKGGLSHNFSIGQ